MKASVSPRAGDAHDPSRQEPDVAAEHAEDHAGVDAFGNPPEQPSDWGWSHDFGKLARIGGWISVILLVLMATKSVTHYNDAGTLALLISAGLVVVGLAWDIYRRRTAWRN
jgi:hypothetical protein